ATNTDTSGTLGPPVDFMPGGLTTIPYIYSEPELYFSQMALNTQPERVQSFLRGRRLFHTDFETGAHSESGNPPFDAHAGQLGPLFNVSACSSCHQGNGRNVVEQMGDPLLTTVVKLYNGGDFGRQLQPQEAEVSRVEYGTIMVDMGDGDLELQQPTYEGLDMSTQPSIRMARRLIGLGLLEAVAEETILERAVAPGCDSDVAISGLASVVTDPETGEPRLGRFGWKAEKVDLRHQIADALDQDMGITTRIFGEPPEELSDDELLDLQTYMRLIAVPPRRAPEDPEVRHGKEVFDMIGCVACHHPSMETSDTHPFAELRAQTIEPYTDLLLHNMGEGLADIGGGPLAQQWRTPPLWGIGLLARVTGELRLLHDGRARSVEEAVAWHGGEAKAMRDAFLQLSSEDRAAVVAFIQSL
ncbi:MAG: di-heme oxidoredictase family protein, partial [Myxococcota bacterium]